MGALDLNQADFLFESKALGRGAVQVLGFNGHEEISRPFLFTIDLVSTKPDLPLEAPIGEPACLELRGRLPGTGQRYSRFVHGIVERFEHVRVGVRHHQYQTTLVPTLLPLFHTRRCRIFQQMSTPDIVQTVLKGQVPSEWIETMLHGRYSGRDYCVQYQESDLDFASRLLESDGIFYFFDHDSDKDVTVLGDGKHAYVALPHHQELRHYDHPHLYEEGLYEFRAAATMRPGAVALRDFRFKQPGVDMEARKDSQDRFSRLEMYHFPGRYVDPGMGTRLAQVRLQEQQHDRFKFVSQSNCRDLRPGYTFQLRGHGRKDLNGQAEGYLILSVEHQGSQPQALGEEQGGKGHQPVYEARLVCIQTKVPFCPPRLTPRPSVSGIQTAVVVGPSDEEIHCDEHGRVKIQFHWDREGQRDDNSSCWVRVSQPWGGAGQGGMFIPRIGQEVVVQFLEGDPDRPLIVGRVYNGENLVPHALPATKNISTIRSCSTPGGGGFNEIKFDDSAGREEMFVHAQFDRNEITGHDQTLRVTNNQTDKVGVDRARTVGHDEQITIGNDRIRQVGHDERIAIANDRLRQVGHDEQVTVSNDRIRQVGNNETVSVGSNSARNVGQHDELAVGGNQSHSVAQEQTTQVGGSQSLSVGGAHSVSVGKAATETVGLVKALSVGVAYQISVGGAMNTTVMGTQAEEVGLIKTVTVGKKFELVCGKSKITMDKDGNITIEGKHVQITADLIDLN